MKKRLSFIQTFYITTCLLVGSQVTVLRLEARAQSTPTGNVSVWVYGPGAGLRLPVAVELVSQAYHRQLTLTRSNVSGPGCGSAANTFTDVPPGFYDWIATTGQSPPMQGRLQVRAGQCTSQQVNVNGSSNATGSVMFWAQADRRTLLTPPPSVTLTGTSPSTRNVSATYTSAPECNSFGGAFFADLPPGNYRFVTSGGVSPSSGTVGVMAGTCVNRALTVTTPNILATGPVQGTAYTGNFGNPTSGNTKNSSGAPGTTGRTTGRSTGSGSTTSGHTNTGAGNTTSGGSTPGLSGTTSGRAGSSSAGSTTSTTRGTLPGGAAGSCPSMNDYVVVVSNTTGTVCGEANSRTITVRNTSAHVLTIRVGIERADGTLNCGASLKVAPGETFSQSSCSSNGNYLIQSMTRADYDAGCRIGQGLCK